MSASLSDISQLRGALHRSRALRRREVSVRGVRVGEFVRSARESVQWVRCQRVCEEVISLSRNLLSQRRAETAAKLCETALNELQTFLDGIAEDRWIRWAAGELFTMLAAAQLSLGRLFACLVSVNKGLDLVLEARYYIQLLRIRSYVMVLIGADQLALRDIVATEDLVNKNKTVTVLLRPLPELLVTFTAADWHRTRRKVMVEDHPEIKEKLFETREGSKDTGLFLASILLGLVCVHLATIAAVGWMGRFWFTLLVSVTLGACVAYGFQALNHDLSHLTHNKDVNFLLMITSSAICNFPWAMYYLDYHGMHHAYTGGNMDRDGDILFQPWHSPPCIELSLCWPQVQKSSVKLVRWSEHFDRDTDAEPLSSKEQLGTTKTVRIDMSVGWERRLLWGTLVPTFLYPMFLMRKLLLDSLNPPRIEHEGLMLAGQIVAFRIGGWHGVFFLWLSAAFSLGACCHPFLGFWLIQHRPMWRQPRLGVSEQLLQKLKLQRFTEPVPQPTVSYSGSFVWHVLNFGELWHVEHHDLPVVPAVNYPALRKIAPEMYKDLSSCPSILDAVKEWLFSDDVTWMQDYGDFARRDAYLNDAWQHEVIVECDSKEHAEYIAEEIVSAEPSSLYTCGMCYLPLQSSKEQVVSAVMLSCECGDLMHTACADAMVECPSCFVEVGSCAPDDPGLTMRLLRCRSTHEAHCLSNEPCAECRGL